MELLSTEEAAGYLRLNTKRVQALARAGRLPGRRIGRKWLFDRRDLDDLLGGPRLRLAAGDEVIAVIKSTEIMIGREPGAA